VVRAGFLAVALAAALSSASSHAQPADLPIPAATTKVYPPGVAVNRKLPVPVYVDRRGRTLYGMDMRTVLRWSPDAAQFCGDACLADWEPLLAPAGAIPNIRFPEGAGRSLPDGAINPLATRFIDNRTAPDWTVIAGPRGAQWVYKGWHLVFTRKGKTRASAEFDGAESLIWNTLKFVPPVPEFVAPPGVGLTPVGGDYVFSDAGGNLLFTGTCAADCSDWTPLPAAMLSKGVGAWKVNLTGDRPQWQYSGAPVFVSDGAALPIGAALLRPAPKESKR
jgi:predicted lipoprotein with Yx(FWY)xxD motif